MKRNGLAGAAVLMAAALLGGSTMFSGSQPIQMSEPNRGWAGYMGDSKKKRAKKTNRLRCAHNAKLKRRKQS